MKPHKKYNQIFEITIFSALTAICLNSAYSIFIQPPSPKQMSMENGEVAFRDTFVELNVPCETIAKLDTSAGRVRLRGLFCKKDKTNRTPAAQESSAQIRKKLDQMVMIQILKNDYKPTVFANDNGLGYSTDFIPLQTGSNEIQITIDQGNKKLTQTLYIQRK